MKLSLKPLLEKLVTANMNIYTKTVSVTFSNGVGTVQESGVTTSTKVIAIPTLGSGQNISSLAISSKVSAANTIQIGAYNTQANGSLYTGSMDITLLIDNR